MMDSFIYQKTENELKNDEKINFLFFCIAIYIGGP